VGTVFEVADGDGSGRQHGHEPEGHPWERRTDDEVNEQGYRPQRQESTDQPTKHRARESPQRSPAFPWPRRFQDLVHRTAEVLFGSRHHTLPGLGYAILPHPPIPVFRSEDVWDPPQVTEQGPTAQRRASVLRCRVMPDGGKMHTSAPPLSPSA
jgi:hypothetical protein